MAFDAGDCPASMREEALAALIRWWQGGNRLNFNEAAGAIRALEELDRLTAERDALRTALRELVRADRAFDAMTCPHNVSGCVVYTFGAHTYRARVVALADAFAALAEEDAR